MARAQVTERTFYPPLMDIISEFGGSSVSEVCYNSYPDIQFEMLGETWLLPVKIGQTTNILKSAFLQYQRHKDESKLAHGVMLFLPDGARQIAANAQALDAALRTMNVTCLIDTPTVKEEYADAPFTRVLERLVNEVEPKIKRGIIQTFPMPIVIALMRSHLEEVMETISASEESVVS